MGLVLLQNPQKLGDLGVPGGVEDGGLQVLQHGLAPVAGGVEVLLVDDAHDVVDGLVVDGDAGVAALHKQGGHLLHGAVLLGGHQVHPGGKNLGDLQVVELDGVADEVALVLIQAALGLGLVHHAHQLLLGDAVVPVVAHHHGQKALPLAKQEVGRGQHKQKQPQQRGGEHSPGLGVLLGQALGGDLAEDEDDHGEHNGGHRGTPDAVNELDEQHRADGGGHVVDNVVANQNGGQQLVVVLRKGQGLGRPPVSGVRLGAKADAVEGGEGGLRGGEIGGHSHQDDECDNHAYTGTVKFHVEKINSAFFSKLNTQYYVFGLEYIIPFPGMQRISRGKRPDFPPARQFYQEFNTKRGKKGLDWRPRTVV